MHNPYPFSLISTAGVAAKIAFYATALLFTQSVLAFEVSGCWSRDLDDPYLRQKLVVIDKDGWGKEIEFVYTAQTVQHACTIPGLAQKNGTGSFTFKDKPEYWSREGWEGYGYPYAKEPCELKVELDREKATIKSIGDCKGLCDSSEIDIELPSGCK